jgi:seryl-tRNA synthetase
MKNKTTLYGLGLEFVALKDLCEDVEFNPETGEVIDNSEELKALFENLSDDINNKLDGAMYVIKELEANSNTLKDEAKRLNARAKTNDNSIVRLKDMIKSLVSLQEGKKIKTLKFNFAVATTESLTIDDESQVPSDYINFTPKVDKAQLKKDIKNGKVEATESFYISRNDGLRVR